MAVELRTNVIIGGRTDSSFDTLAARIASIASAIDALGGSWARQFGSESLDVFKDYETYMLEAKGAMSGQYESASMLEQAYDGLQKKAQEWASTSIFHTNDVAKAISEAAHAGWEYDEMLQGIPNAMLLAQAGNLNLSTGLDYLIKTLNGTGTAFEDSGQLVDQWVMAANSSATTVGELGDAMTKMGATARFGDSNAELLALLGTLANAGAVGTEAGTLLRNTMLRLLAPTDKAGAAMKILGASAEEIDAVLADKTITKAAKELDEMGFSAYTAEGELKPIIQTFQELDECLKGLTEERQNELLSAIFPTRTITGARAILSSIGEIGDLYEKILGSNGYAERVAKTQTSGLMGAQELFLSKWEEFKRKVGEELSDPMEKLYEYGGGLIDKLNSLDPVAMSTLTGAFEGLAAAGPFLGTAATVMFAVRRLGVAGTGVMLAATGVGALVGYLSKINEMELEGTFGDMSANLTDIGTALDTVSQNLANDMASFTSYGNAAKAAAQAYQEAGTTLTENLWTKMVTGTKVEEGTPEYNELMTSAETMIGALNDGITKATETKIKLTDYLFDTNVFDEANKESDPVYASLMSLLTVGYDGAIAKAKSKSKELREAMISAFSDGKLEEAELTNIQRIMDEMNELMASVNDFNIEKYYALNKSQRVSLDSVEQFTKEVAESREKSAAALTDNYDYLKAYTQAMYDWAVANDQTMIDPITGNKVKASDVNIDYIINSLERQYQTKLAETTAAFDEYIVKGWNNAFKTSDAGGIYGTMQDALGLFQSGMIDYKTATDWIQGAKDQEGWNQLGQALDSMIGYYGGTDAMAAAIKNYRTAGGATNLSNAAFLEQALMMYGLTTGKGIPELSGMQTQERLGVDAMRAAIAEVYNSTDTFTDEMFAGVKAVYDGLTREQKAAWDMQVAQQGDKFDLGFAADELGGYALNNLFANWLGAYALTNGKVYSKDEYAKSETADFASRDERHAYMDRMREQETRNNALREQLTELYERQQKAQETVSSYETLLSKYDAEIADLQQQRYEDAGVDASRMTAMDRRKLANTPISEELQTAMEVKESVTAGLTEAQNTLAEINAQIAETQSALNEPVNMTIETNADDAAAGIQAAAAGPYEAFVEVIYNDPGFTPSGGGTITVDVVYNDSGGSTPGSASGGSSTSSIASKAKSAFSAAQSKVKSMLSKFFAEGGRTDEPAIFGEGSTAEWAIPERHDERTADLLNAARQASGFSWNELISRYGGLNARTDGITVNIGSYAPVITATDANGVENKLIEDKKRLKEMVRSAVKDALEESALHDAIEIYA